MSVETYNIFPETKFSATSWKFCLPKHIVGLQLHIVGINIGNKYR